MIKDAAGRWSAGTVEARNGGSTLFLSRGFLGGDGNWSPSNHLTSVAGSITFEIE
jgi:hypothetical protein